MKEKSERKKEEERIKKPNAQRESNPQPRYHEASVLPLCYNRSPTYYICIFLTKVMKGIVWGTSSWLVCSKKFCFTSFSEEAEETSVMENGDHLIEASKVSMESKEDSKPDEVRNPISVNCSGTD